jgi:hypothetical protein
MIALLLSACVTETGNPEMNVELRVTGQSSTERVAVAIEKTITAAWVIVDDVRLVEADGCETAAEVEYTAQGPFELDLLGTPVVIPIAAEPTTYCRLRVRMDRADGVDAAPAGLDDYALYLSGTRSDGVPFVLRSREKFEFDLRATGDGFALEAGHDQLVLAYDIGAWLDAVDLSLASLEDGTIFIDDEFNEHLLEDFETAADGALSLHADDDGDGVVGDDDALLAND